MTTKQDLHRLIDELPEWALPDAQQLLEPLRASCDDPLMRAFMDAPIDDEPLTPDEIAAIEEGHEDLVRGDIVPWKEVEACLLHDAQWPGALSLLDAPSES